MIANYVASQPTYPTTGCPEDTRIQNGCVRYTADLEGWFGMGRLRSDLDGGLQRANQLKRKNSLAYGEILSPVLRCPRLSSGRPLHTAV